MRKVVCLFFCNNVHAGSAIRAEAAGGFEVRHGLRDQGEVEALRMAAHSGEVAVLPDLANPWTARRRRAVSVVPACSAGALGRKMFFVSLGLNMPCQQVEALSRRCEWSEGRVEGSEIRQVSVVVVTKEGQRARSQTTCSQLTHCFARFFAVSPRVGIFVWAIHGRTRWTGNCEIGRERASEVEENEGSSVPKRKLAVLGPSFGACNACLNGTLNSLGFGICGPKFKTFFGISGLGGSKLKKKQETQGKGVHPKKKKQCEFKAGAEKEEN